MEIKVVLEDLGNGDCFGVWRKNRCISLQWALSRCKPPSIRLEKRRNRRNPLVWQSLQGSFRSSRGAYVRTRPRSSDFTTLFWHLTPVDAIQLVLDLCDEDIHLSSLHFNPGEARGPMANHVSNLQLRAIIPRLLWLFPTLQTPESSRSKE